MKYETYRDLYLKINYDDAPVVNSIFKQKAAVDLTWIVFLLLKGYSDYDL